MRINEIIIESTELEEGWKSKLGAAALAGAAALSGGPADAGGGITLNVVGKSYDSQGNTIVKYQDGSTRNLGTNVWTSPTMAQQRQNQALAKQKADREAAARASRQSSYVQNYRTATPTQLPQLSAPWQKYYNDSIASMNRDIAAAKNELTKPLTSDQKIAFKKQIDWSISTFVKGPNGLEAAETAGLNKDAVKMLNNQLDQLKNLSSSIRP